MKTKLSKEKYPEGTRIKCINMEDPQAVPSGTLGTVQFVDDIGTIHVAWDNDSSLGLVPGEDQFQIIHKQEKSYEKSFVNIEVNAPIVRKSTLDSIKNIVNVSIKLNYSDYHDLLNNYAENRDYIEDHLEQMYQDEYGINHNILVYCDEEPDGILIESEGYNYARYQGYVSNVHELLETNTYSSLN